jgi:hypothetical protein
MLPTMTEPAKKRPGRPPVPPDQRLKERMELRLSTAQLQKLERLGGAKWVRSKIDKAKEPPQ